MPVWKRYFKTDEQDHFSIAMVLKTDEPIHQSQKVENAHKRNYDEKVIEWLKHQLWVRGAQKM